MHRIQRIRVLPRKEPPRGDHRARKTRHALEALTKVEAGGGVLGTAEHGDVRVGGDLEGAEAAADDEGAAYETAVFLVYGGGPEEYRAWRESVQFEGGEG